MVFFTRAMPIATNGYIQMSQDAGLPISGTVKVTKISGTVKITS